MAIPADHQHSELCNCARDISEADFDAAIKLIGEVLEGRITPKPWIAIVPPWLYEYLQKEQT
jgi:hypothetical protein